MIIKQDKVKEIAREVFAEEVSSKLADMIVELDQNKSYILFLPVANESFQELVTSELKKLDTKVNMMVIFADHVKLVEME